jgi:O-antigen/teichoic acid export membrane protein
MELKNKIILNTAYRIVFLLLQLIITFIIPVITGPEGFGFYSMVIANATLILTLTSLGIPSGLTYHASKRDCEPDKLNNILYLSTFIQLIVVVVAEILFFQFWDKFVIWPSGNILFGVSGILLFASLVLTEKYYAIYNGYNHLKTYNKLTVVFSLVTIFFLFILILDKQVDTNAVLFVVICVSCLQALYMANGARTVLKENRSISAAPHEQRFKFLSYSLKSYIANTFQFLANRIDYWILLLFWGQMQLGHYSLSSRLGQLLLILPLILSAVIFPSVTSIHFKREKLDLMIRLINSLNISIGFIAVFLAFYLIPIFFGKEFQPSVIPFLILIPGMILKSLITMLATYFAGKGLVGINLRNSALSVLLIVILDFMLIPKHGPTGAALAITIAYIVSSFHALRAYRQIEKISDFRFIASLEEVIWMKNYSFQILKDIRSNKIKE